MPSFGSQLPHIETSPPGELSTNLIDSLARTECPAITARRARRERETGVDQDPIVWERARGANVEDVDGNVYVDMTSGFAVAGLGHNPEAVREAAHDQVDSLTHAMGDVYPARTKIEFCDLLADVTPGDLQQSIVGLSGSDAVQAALKTAAVYSGEPGAVAFWGGYHGMAYGALSATAYRKAFRRPFLGQLNRHIQHVPYPDPFRPPLGRDAGAAPDRVLADCMAHLEQLVDGPATGGEGIGAVVVEPIQGRGGEVVPPLLAGHPCPASSTGLPSPAVSRHRRLVGAGATGHPASQPVAREPRPASDGQWLDTLFFNFHLSSFLFAVSDLSDLRLPISDLRP